ncbi:hypothetical protein [Hymenobacter glaciei]|uniref:hypothetical protein n=1 Tax=Hymenobacter glaciei TaxID=877209 RepID=UPI0031E9AF05
MRYGLLSLALLFVKPGTARAQFVNGVYKTRHHVAFEGEIFRFTGNQFVYLWWTDVGSLSGRGTYQLVADTLRLYFKTPAPPRYGMLIDSGKIYRYRIAKIRKNSFSLQSLQPYSLHYWRKYHQQKDKTRLEVEK